MQGIKSCLVTWFPFGLLLAIVACSNPPSSTPSVVPSAPTSTAVSAPTTTSAPLDRVLIEPQRIVLEPNQRHQFFVNPVDTTGNRLGQVNFSWASDPASGSIDPSGLFTAGTRVGEFPAAVRVVAEAEGISREATATVAIQPGPIEDVEIIPPQPTLFTGNSVSFKAAAFDQYGNAIRTFKVTWLAGGGEITGTGDFTAGRKPGTFEVAAIVSDGKSSAGASESVTVEQGYCETHKSVLHGSSIGTL